jgi:hypothetical protein
MMVSGFAEIFTVGCLGGLLGELLKWYTLRESPSLPTYARSVFYWVVTLSMTITGGLLATLYGLDTKNALLILNIGLSAPLMVKAMAESVAPTGFRQSEQGSATGYDMSDAPVPVVKASVIDFLKWR